MESKAFMHGALSKEEAEGEPWRAPLTDRSGHFPGWTDRRPIPRAGARGTPRRDGVDRCLSRPAHTPSDRTRERPAYG